MPCDYSGVPTDMDMSEENGNNVILNKDADVKEINRGCSRTWCQYIQQNLMMILIMVGICLGFGLGLAIRELQPSEDAILWIGMPGDLYMRLLKMTIMPLIVCSVIAGASTLDPKMSGKIGGIIVVLVVLTHIIGCCMATGLVMLIRPGGQSKTATKKEFEKPMKTHDVFADLLRNLIPENMIEAAFRHSVTKYVLDDKVPDINESLLPTNASNPGNSNNSSSGNLSGNNATATREAIVLHNAAKEYSRVVSHSNGINVLGLVMISAVFGIAAGKIKKDVPFFLSFIENVLSLVLIVVRWFFWLTPIGVLSLIAQSVSKVDDVGQTFSDLGLFIATAVTALFLHWVLVLPALYAITVRRNPFRFFVAQLSAVSIAFAATATTIAIPEMLNVCENKFKMDKRITRIAIPVTVTLNADGSAIFIVVASLFISDYTGVDFTFNNVLVALVLTIVSSLAIPGVPSASIFTVIIILTAMQVPLQNVAILFAVEWLLDRIRTGLNSASHMTIVACTHALCKKTLRRMDEAAMNDDLQQVDSKIHKDQNTHL